jgi:hypothetical protein
MYSYTDNSDFNKRNNLVNAKNYFSNVGGSTNISYTNLFNKNINLNAWVGVYNQNFNGIFLHYNLFPLNRCWWFTRNIISDSIDSFHLIDNSVRYIF